MGFYYQDGFTDLDTTYDGLLEAISADYNDPHNWEQIYQNPASTSYNFNTSEGVQNTTSLFTVFRGKLNVNGVGTDPVNYAYLILEKDTPLNRIKVRTCQSFTGAGVNVGVTSDTELEDADLYLNNITSNDAVSFCGDDNNVTISVRSNLGVDAVTLFALRNFPDALTDDNAYGLLKLAEDVCFVQGEGVLDCNYPDADLNTSIQAGSTPVPVMSEFAIGDTDTFVGFAKQVYKSNNTSPNNYDILTKVGGVLFRAFPDSDGFKGVRN